MRNTFSARQLMSLQFVKNLKKIQASLGITFLKNIFRCRSQGDFRIFCRHFGANIVMKNAEKNEGGWNHLAVGRDQVELPTVLSCGQSFRWKNDGPDPSEWTGVFSHHVWILKQTDNGISYKVYPEIPEETSSQFLENYLQLDVSLSELYKKWADVDSKFATLTESEYKGIRMLNQDPVENLFSFICSSNNNIIRISQMVENLCTIYGEPIEQVNGKLYHDFPKLVRLTSSEVEERLRKEKFGYRAAFIVNSAKKIIENGGPEWLESLKKLSYDEARVELQTLPGIGRKVADCICLMSLGFPDAIPVDTHMHQVGKQYLPHLNQYKSLTDKVYSEISNYFRSMYGEYSGWAHSVLFASTLRHLKSESAGKKSSGKKGANKKVKDEDSIEIEVVKPANKSKKRVKKPTDDILAINGTEDSPKNRVTRSGKRLKTMI